MIGLMIGLLILSCYFIYLSVITKNPLVFTIGAALALLSGWIHGTSQGI